MGGLRCVADRRCLRWSFLLIEEETVMATSQQQRTAVVWGCATHRTPRGETCQGCLDQGDLFHRADVPAQRTFRRTR